MRHTQVTLGRRPLRFIAVGLVLAATGAPSDAAAQSSSQTTTSDQTTVPALVSTGTARATKNGSSAEEAPENSRLQRLLTKLGQVQHELHNVEQTQGDDKLLAAILSPASGLIVGLIAFFGLGRQIKSSRNTAQDELAQAATLERTRNARAVMREFEPLITNASTALNELRDRALAQPRVRDATFVQLIDQTGRRVAEAREIRASLAAAGVDSALLNQYSDLAAKFIDKARTGSALDIQNAWEEFWSVSETLTETLRSFAESLDVRLVELEHPRP
jgi:hypothetical protein